MTRGRGLALLFFAVPALAQEDAVVVTATRTARPALEVPASVDRIYADEISEGKAQAMNEVRGGPARAEDPKRYEGLRKLMTAKPSAGTNTVISSHANPFYALTGPPYLAEGEMAVLRPGDDSFAIVGRIRIEDWQALK